MNLWTWAVAALIVVSPLAADVKPQTVTFPTDDGVVLSGTLFKAGPDFVLLSSQHRTSQYMWQDFAYTLGDLGYSVLTYDYRGNGDSQGEASTDLSVRDVTAAYQYLKSLGARRVVLIGASLGATLTYRAALPVPAVLVSPGAPPAEPVAAKRGPLLFITSQYDFSRNDTEALFAAAPEPKQFFLAQGRDHGNGIVDGPDERVKPLILSFVNQAFR